MFVCCGQYCCYTFLVLKTILNHAYFFHKSSFIIDEKWMHGKGLEKCFFLYVVWSHYLLLLFDECGYKWNQIQSYLHRFSLQIKKKIALSGVVIKINRNNLFCLLF